MRAGDARATLDLQGVHKDHVYKTIVMDIMAGRIVYVGDGNGKDALDGFWEKLGERKKQIKAVCTDLSKAFTRAVTEHLPQGRHSKGLQAFHPGMV